MDVGVMILLAGAFAVPGIFTGLIAQSKGYSFAVAFFASVWFSLIGTLFVLLFLPDRSEDARDRVSG